MTTISPAVSNAIRPIANVIRQSRVAIHPAPAARRAHNLNLNMQRQQQTEWCWSAVAISVALFYNAGGGNTQCTLVNQELTQTTCCVNGASSLCNRPWYLDRALSRVGYLISWQVGTISFTGVKGQVDTTHLVAARIGWAGGGGHFVVLDGYDTAGGQYLSVRDPWYGSSTYPYARFATAYQGTGSWTHTYFT